MSVTSFEPLEGLSMNVSKWIAGALIGVVAATFAFDAEAQRRLGGGKSFGKQSQPVQQRQATPPQQQTPPQAAPAQQPGTAAAPAAATGTAAAAGAAAKTASPMRNLLIGAAAGLGLMALASWLGFGETLATIMLFVLLGVVLMMVVGYFMRRSAMNRGPQPAYQGAGYGSAPSAPQPVAAPQPRSEPGAALGHPGRLRHRGLPRQCEELLHAAAGRLGQRQPGAAAGVHHQRDVHRADA
jgi:hypothetical protein